MLFWFYCWFDDKSTRTQRSAGLGRIFISDPDIIECYFLCCKAPYCSANCIGWWAIFAVGFVGFCKFSMVQSARSDDAPRFVVHLHLSVSLRLGDASKLVSDSAHPGYVVWRTGFSLGIPSYFKARVGGHDDHLSRRMVGDLGF